MSAPTQHYGTDTESRLFMADWKVLPGIRASHLASRLDKPGECAHAVCNRTTVPRVRTSAFHRQISILALIKSLICRIKRMKLPFVIVVCTRHPTLSCTDKSKTWSPTSPFMPPTNSGSISTEIFSSLSKRLFSICANSPTVCRSTDRHCKWRQTDMAEW